MFGWGGVGWGMSPLCCTVFLSLLVFKEADTEKGVGCEEWAEERLFGLEAGSCSKGQAEVLKSGWGNISSWFLSCLESKDSCLPLFPSVLCFGITDQPSGSPPGTNLEGCGAGLRGKSFMLYLHSSLTCG